jgi:mRNA interferase MazF
VRRGDVWLVNFDPPVGSEIDKLRPAVVVSNNGANSSVTRTGRGVVTVVPLSSNVTRVLPFQVFLPASRSGLRKDSKAQTEQVRCVSRLRVGRQLGQLPAAQVAQIDSALRVHLGLN